MKKILLRRHNQSSSGGGGSETSIYFSLYLDTYYLDISQNPNVILIGDYTVEEQLPVEIDADFYDGDPIDFVLYNIPSGTSVRMYTSGIDMLNIKSINDVTVDENYEFDLTFVANSSTEQYSGSSLSFIPPAYCNYPFDSIYLTDPSLLGYIPINVLMTLPNNEKVTIPFDIYL